jgi:CheY-like chemotaxis protein
MNKPQMLKLLIVEDEPPVASVIAAIANKSFACEKLLVAKDGDEALALLDKHVVDIVISDWNMPNKNGEELLLEMRKNEHTREVPFLMLTGRGDRESVQSAVSQGAQGYVIKPFTGADLSSKISRLTGIKSKFD